MRTVLALRKGGRAGREEGDGRSREGPSEETHIPNNIQSEASVAIRPLRREDVDAFATWARHTDPLFGHYNLPSLSPADAEQLWVFLSGSPQLRRPYAGLADGRVVATLIEPGTGSLTDEELDRLGKLIEEARRQGR